MRTYIKIDMLARTKIEAEFNVCRRTVINALEFVSSSEISNRIRARALELGGIYMTESFLPNCEVRHTDAQMIQTFPGQVVLMCHKQNGSCALLINGTTIESYDSVPAQGWGSLVAKAQNLSDAIVRHNSRV